MLTFNAVLKFLKALVVLCALNEMLIRVLGTAENQEKNELLCTCVSVQ